MIREETIAGRGESAGREGLGQAVLDLTTARDRVFGLTGFRAIGHALRVADAICGIAAFLALGGGTGTSLRSSSFLLGVAISVPLWITIFQFFGLHRIDHLSSWDEFRGTLGATGLSLMTTLAVTTWLGRPLNRPAFVWIAIVALVLELGLRRSFRRLLVRMQASGRLSLRTVLVGANDEAARLVQALGQPGRGFDPVGYVAVAGSERGGNGLAVIGEIDALEDVIHRHRIECVVVAASAASPSDLLEVSRACRRTGIEMKVSANLPDAVASRMSVQRLGEMMAITFKPVRITERQAAIKRCFDVVVGSAILLLALPVMLVVGLAIRISTGGPALFRQARGTKGGLPFTMYKFRTMVEDPDRALDGAVVDLTRPFFKLEDDPRLTPIGRILRKLSLDELPQLWNVVRGDMSLVGPRPLPYEQVEANADALAPRHEVRAGLTGWWQISGRSDLDSDEALRLDVFYIENWSISLDLYILIRTMGTVLGGRGAV